MVILCEIQFLGSTSKKTKEIMLFSTSWYKLFRLSNGNLFISNQSNFYLPKICLYLRVLILHVVECLLPCSSIFLWSLIPYIIMLITCRHIYSVPKRGYCTCVSNNFCQYDTFFVYFHFYKFLFIYLFIYIVHLSLARPPSRPNMIIILRVLI